MEPFPWKGLEKAIILLSGQLLRVFGERAWSFPHITRAKAGPSGVQLQDPGKGSGGPLKLWNMHRFVGIIMRLSSGICQIPSALDGRGLTWSTIISI